MSLALAGVVKRYGSRVALDGVDLAVARGRDPRAAGAQRRREVDARRRSPAACSRPTRARCACSGRPGVAFQEIGIYPSLTVRENLWAFAEVHGVLAARAERLLEPFVLSELADRPPGG